MAFKSPSKYGLLNSLGTFELNLNIDLWSICFDFTMFLLIHFSINYTLKYTVNKRYAKYTD